MKRFKNITELLKAFRKGDVTAGRTPSVCSNYNTDFKKQPKYYFIDDIYFENGKAVRFINRNLKIEIVLCNYNPLSYVYDTPDGYQLVSVRDNAYVREYIRIHTKNDISFSLAIRFCLTNSYINDFINIKNSIKTVRTSAYYLLCRYYQLRKDYQSSRRFINNKCKKANISIVDTYIDQEFAISAYKGWRECWSYYKYYGSVSYADLSLKLNKDEILTLIKKTFLYNPVRLSHHTSKYMSYSHFMKYYDNLAHLKNDIKSLANHIKSANLTPYQRWNSKQIEYIAKIIQKYGLPF